MKKRKNRNYEIILKLLTKQIHIVWNMKKKQNNDIIEHERRRSIRSHVTRTIAV
jgi:hypothetical protein